jgi:hypothetical protein
MREKIWRVRWGKHSYYDSIRRNLGKVLVSVAFDGEKW